MLALLLPLLLAAPASAQCPPSKVVAAVTQDDTPGCVTVTADEALPELAITNGCEDVQFHVEAGLDCPYCGPPLTLRAGTFGRFTVETRPAAAFTPESPVSSHSLSWALGEQTGTLRVDVVPDIVPCTAADVGTAADSGTDLGASPPESVDAGGCATAHPARAGWLGWGVLLFAGARRARRRTRR